MLVTSASCLVPKHYGEYMLGAEQAEEQSRTTLLLCTEWQSKQND
jgi:hypothetical protein